MKFHLIGEDTKIEIEVLGRSHPNTTDYWDGNWLFSKINLNIPGYLAGFPMDLRTDELQDFTNELKKLEKEMVGKAILKNLDGYYHFEGEIDQLGKIKWSAETCYPAGHGAILNFEFKSDQSYLQGLIKELEQILTEFPVIGIP
ncbi:hypothetical protein SAMN05877753_11061 [Bacillus oleivorans]|uniref:Uncharacterized protein n=1 Tax=Bacillus oleivorans TaxID=1448271 RepID=A0A285D4L7_9BACI|nr:hypothetical protein [Bacillus oleivorans]SNX74764.1 hypothetical protein SAMN05877753_11061 [Bacillus oleivorans]